MSETNGLYFEKKGEGDPVVLLHGFTLDASMWDDQFEFLAQSYQTIRFDHRGHGRSRGVEGNYSQSGDVRTLLEFLGIDRAHMVGLSMGGLIASVFAIENPDMVRSLTLVDAGSSFDPSRELDGRIFKYIIGAGSKGLEAGLKNWVADPLFGPANKIPTVRDKLTQIVLVGHLAQGDGSFFLRSREAVLPSPPPEERLGEIKAPTLVVVGELDLVEFHENADRFISKIPRAEKVVISGVGHMSNMEKPTEFNRILTDFLSKQG